MKFMKVIFKNRFSVIRFAQFLVSINYFSKKLRTKRKISFFYISVRRNFMDPVCDVTEASSRPDEEERRERSRGPR